jgi:hypothetical protein
MCETTWVPAVVAFATLASVSGVPSAAKRRM